MALQERMRSFRERPGRGWRYLNGLLNHMQYLRFNISCMAEMEKAKAQYENWTKETLLEHRKQQAFGVITKPDSVREYFRCSRCHSEFFIEARCDVFPKPKFWGSGKGGGIFLMNPNGEMRIPWRCSSCRLPYVLLIHRKKPKSLPDDKLMYPGILKRPLRVHRVKFGDYEPGVTVTRQMSCKCHGLFRIVQISCVDLGDKKPAHITEINE